MNSVQKRFLLFLFGCIPSRLFLVFLAKYGDKTVRNILSIITFMIGTGFMFIYIGGLRKTGLETGGDVIWWNDLRPIHSLLYYGFSILTYYNYKNAWQLLLLDVIIGLSAFLIFHYRMNDIPKVFEGI
jgi:hypothetical protein